MQLRLETFISKEGDLILTDVMYDSERDLVYVITDSTRDRFSAESDRVISVREFDAITEFTYADRTYQKSG